MATHYLDLTRFTTDPRPGEEYYRLLGVDDGGNPYFYWTQTPGEFGSYWGPNYDHVWGNLTHITNMTPETRVFIADLEMVRKFERFGLLRPCGGCRRAEYREWKSRTFRQ
jgi:hypothetical protein